MLDVRINDASHDVVNTIATINSVRETTFSTVIELGLDISLAANSERDGTQLEFADGDTILFNDQGDIMKSVTPKKGRVLVFDGSILHGGGIPKKGPRCIVNYDVKVVK